MAIVGPLRCCKRRDGKWAGTGWNAPGGGSLDFGSQALRAASAEETVTLTNSSAVELGITASGDFAQTNDRGSLLDASSGCTISVTFTTTTS